MNSWDEEGKKSQRRLFARLTYLLFTFPLSLSGCLSNYIVVLSSIYLFNTCFSPHSPYLLSVHIFSFCSLSPTSSFFKYSTCSFTSHLFFFFFLSSYNYIVTGNRCSLTASVLLHEAPILHSLLLHTSTSPSPLYNQKKKEKKRIIKKNCYDPDD